jgi:hypothetical protein
MKHSDSILSLLAEISEVLGGSAFLYGLFKGITSLLRPIKVRAELSADHLNVIVKVKVRRSESVSIPDAGISVSKRRVGIQIKGIFLGLRIGKETLTLAPLPNTKVSKNGWSQVAEQPLIRIRGAAADTKKNFTPPFRSYACHNNSRMTVGRRIRLPG